MSDAQWEVLRPEAEAVMAGLRRGPGGVMRHDLRAMLDAIGYVTRCGIEWRALPVDFPPWTAVYAFFERWSARGLPERLVDRLRGRIRVAVGRAETPSAAVIDSQSVKAAETVGAACSGWDGGYAGRLVAWTRQALGLAVQIVKRSDDMKGFVVLPRRWVVERSYAWLMRHRRLVRCYERDPAHHEAMIWWAAVHQMTRRLTRELAGQPPPAAGAAHRPCPP